MGFQSRFCLHVVDANDPQVRDGATKVPPPGGEPSETDARGAGQRALTGLTSVLSGELPLSDALIPLQPNLWTLPAGPVPDDSVPLLASQEMAALLKGVADSFEYVIIDSPPVLAATDAPILSSLVDGVLLVTASGRTSRVGLVRARKILVTAGAKILGTTFNKLDPHHPDYSDSYSQYASG